MIEEKVDITVKRNDIQQAVECDKDWMKWKQSTHTVHCRKLWVKTDKLMEK